MFIGYGNNKLLRGKKKKSVLRKTSKLLLKYPDCLFITEPSSAQVHTYGVISRYPGKDVDYDKALYWEWWEEKNPDGSKDSSLAVDTYGDFLAPIDGSAAGLAVNTFGTFITAIIFPYDGSSVKVGTYGNIFTKATRKNWVKWSNGKQLNFTLGKGNVAGSQPMGWSGFAYGARKLANKVVVYGENGVSFLIPTGKAMGMATPYHTGVKGRKAFAGDNSIQFFVDLEGRLFQITETMEKLDYSEYLSSLSSSIVMSYDSENSMLYLCDGTYGYVYSVMDRSLGTCSPYITGVGAKDGTTHIVASDTIVTPVFEICTDIYNLGTHRYKTIFELEIGANVVGSLQAAIDYRDDFQNNFTTTAWATVGDRGNAFITALGREFRIRAKSTPYEYFEIDYININGVIHDH